MITLKCGKLRHFYEAWYTLPIGWYRPIGVPYLHRYYIFTACLRMSAKRKDRHRVSIHCILIHITDAQLWKTKFAEAQEIVRTKCSLYSQSHEPSSDEESSITRSEDTNTPEPKVLENSPNKEKEGSGLEEKDSEGVVLKLKELKVDSGKDE